MSRDSRFRCNARFLVEVGGGRIDPEEFIPLSDWAALHRLSESQVHRMIAANAVAAFRCGVPPGSYDGCSWRAFMVWWVRREPDLVPGEVDLADCVRELVARYGRRWVAERVSPEAHVKTVAAWERGRPVRKAGHRRSLIELWSGRRTRFRA